MRLYHTLAAVLCVVPFEAHALTRYVALDGAHVAPFDTWSKAATNIQSAVDIATDGDTVLVSNGVYASGGMVTPGYALMNRVCVTQRLTLTSLSGPAATVIAGAPDPVTGGSGENAVRGIYMDTGWLIGFTISGGYTRTSGHSLYDACGGGVFSYSAALCISNCVISANTAYLDGGGVWTYGGTADVCTISGNTASSGGGAEFTALNACIISGNSSRGYGGGAHSCTLNGCTVNGNRAAQWGGGLYACSAFACSVGGNVAQVSGGGVAGSSGDQGWFGNCIITGNVAALMGGGINHGTAQNCVISDNRAWFGGGMSYASVVNCTISGNRATYGGGAYHGQFYNSIIYFNDASIDANINQPGETRYCCTTPAVWGTGNITNEPQLASVSHLAATSACRGAGGSSYAAGTDIDGEAWRTPPSMGCDEYWPGAVTGALAVTICATTLQPPLHYPVRFAADIAGRAAGSVWTFDDGAAVTNQPYVSHAWNSLGAHTATLRAFNETYPAGVAAALAMFVVVQPVHYVDAASAGAAWPYTTWATAATTIQDAVDAAQHGSLVVVADGVYASGCRATPWLVSSNRVVVTRDVTIQSLNGPASAIILGAPDPSSGDLGSQAVRGVYMEAGTLAGLTVSNGHTATAGNDYLDRSGGGVYAFGVRACISNCVITGCGSANGGGGVCWGTVRDCRIAGNHTGWGSGGVYTGSGGGTMGGELHGCMISGNRATAAGYGGGAAGGTLESCVISGNLADPGAGGGVSLGTLTACIISSNTAISSGGGAYFSTLNACTISLNRASNGGGLYYFYGTSANDCLIISNYAEYSGGGATFCVLNRCTLVDNIVSNYGGGAAQSTINNCVIRGNTAIDGGGTWNSIDNNCLIVNNRASGLGGGAFCGSYRYLNSCTLAGNSAGDGDGFFVTNGFVRNCIVFLNGSNNWAGTGTVVFTCSLPLPPGQGNISNDPEFVNASTGNYRLFESSPCVNAGTNAYITWSTDLDGTPRIIDGRVDMGAYEFIPEPGVTLVLVGLVGLVRRARSAHRNTP